MIIGIVVVWGAYALGLWGYCLVRSYNVTPKDILNWKFPQSLAGSTTSGGTSNAAPAVPATPGSNAGAPTTGTPGGTPAGTPYATPGPFYPSAGTPGTNPSAPTYAGG